MIDVNETLAEFFQKRPECDADGVFHYLLYERNEALVVDITPHRQWTPEFLKKDILFIDCERNEVSLVWVSNGIHRACIAKLPVETILCREDEGKDDEDKDDRRLVFVGSDIVAQVDLTPGDLSFWSCSRDYFYRMIYEEPAHRALASEKAPLERD